MERESRNIYRIARRTTGYTQEHWAEAVGVSVESIRNYEAGTQVPSDEVVKAMCEISGLAQVSYWHLCNKSTLAAEILPQLKTVPLPQAVCGLVAAILDFTERNRGNALLAIAADGRVDEIERPAFDEIVRDLDAIVKAALQLKYAKGGEEP